MVGICCITSCGELVFRQGVVEKLQIKTETMGNGNVEGKQSKLIAKVRTANEDAAGGKESGHGGCMEIIKIQIFHLNVPLIRVL